MCVCVTSDTYPIVGCNDLGGSRSKQKSTTYTFAFLPTHTLKKRKTTNQKIGKPIFWLVVFLRFVLLRIIYDNNYERYS